MALSKRSKRAENRKKHGRKDIVDKLSVASEPEVDAASDRGGPVTDDADETIRGATNDVSGFKRGVSALPSKGAVHGDDGLDDHKLKVDAATKNKSSSAETTGKCQPQLRHLLGNIGVGAGSRRSSILNQGSAEGVNEADGAGQGKAGQSSRVNSNQSFGQRGPKDRVGDHNQKGTDRKQFRPKIALTKQEEDLIAKAGLPMYLMPAVSEVIESHKNYEFLRKPNESGKARILFEQALARHGLSHTPDNVDPRLFPKSDNSKGSPSKRPDHAPTPSQEELPTSMGAEKGHSGTDGYAPLRSSRPTLCL
ncbi:hypothetical protein HOY82DRAFT_535703 [Tuber indicum]|nr:hypothetical protein HOY82DRAFT_535703 [Tuber indicum]